MVEVKATTPLNLAFVQRLQVLCSLTPSEDIESAKISIQEAQLFDERLEMLLPILVMQALIETDGPVERVSEGEESRRARRDKICSELKPLKIVLESVQS